MYKRPVIGENHAMKETTTMEKGPTLIVLKQEIVDQLEVRVRNGETDEFWSAEALRLAKNGVTLLAFPSQAMLDEWLPRAAELSLLRRQPRETPAPA